MLALYIIYWKKLNYFIKNGVYMYKSMKYGLIFTCFGLLGQNLQAMLTPKINFNSNAWGESMASITSLAKNGSALSNIKIPKSQPGIIPFQYGNKKNNNNSHNNFQSKFSSLHVYGYLTTILGGTLLANYGNDRIKEKNVLEAIDELDFDKLKRCDPQWIAKKSDEILLKLCKESYVWSYKPAHFLGKLLELYPGLIDSFAQSAIAIIPQLCKEKSDTNLLITIVEHKPELAHQLISILSEQYQKVPGCRTGLELLRYLSKNSNTTTDQLSKFAMQWFSTLIESLEGLDFLYTFIDKRPGLIIEELKALTIQYFSDIARGEGKVLIHSLLMQSKSVDEFISPLAENFSNLIQNYDGFRCIKDLINRKPEAADYFMPLVDKNIASMLDNSSYGEAFITFLMEKRSQTIGQITNSIAKNLTELSKNAWLTKSTIRIINEIIQQKPEMGDLLVAPIAQDFTKDLN